jgi:excisionase family DNA binding protein
MALTSLVLYMSLMHSETRHGSDYGGLDVKSTPTDANRSNQSQVLTVNELADFLRVHRSTVYRLLKTKSLPAFRVGSDWRFNTETVNEWMNRKQGRN